MKDYPEKYNVDTSITDEMRATECVYAGPEMMDVYNGPVPDVDPVDVPETEEEPIKKPADDAGCGLRGVLSRLKK